MLLVEGRPSVGEVTELVGAELLLPLSPPRKSKMSPPDAFEAGGAGCLDAACLAGAAEGAAWKLTRRRRRAA